MRCKSVRDGIPSDEKRQNRDQEQRDFPSGIAVACGRIVGDNRFNPIGQVMLLFNQRPGRLVIGSGGLKQAQSVFFILLCGTLHRGVCCIVGFLLTHLAEPSRVGYMIVEMLYDRDTYMSTSDLARPATERDLLEEQLRSNLRGVLRKVLKLDRAVARKLGIHATDLSSLQLLQTSEEPVTPTALARYLGISTGSATAAIDRLEKAGFVRRVRSENDRRGVIIELVKGKPERIQASYRQFQVRFDRLVADFSDDELQVINRFFQGV